MALIINPANGQVLFTEDPTAYYQQGYRDATAEELDTSARNEEFGTFGQQAQAQVERIVRGATLGAVEGFGDPEDIRARAEVSQELSPVISAAASIAPDVAIAAATGGLAGLATGAGRAAGRAALAEGAGLVRAGLAAGQAGGLAALAGESLGTGLVSAGQAAYDEGRSLGDDPGRDAENVLIWGGLNFGLGAAMRAMAGADEIARPELDDIAAAAERRAPELGGVPVSGSTEAAAARAGEREAAQGGVERALRNASKADAEDLVEQAIGEAPVAEADSFGRQRRLYINRDAVLDVAEREMAQDLGSLMEDVGKVARRDKASAIAADVSDNLPAQRAVADGIAEDAARFAGELRAEARAYAAASGKKGQQYAIPGAKGWALALMDNAKAIEQAESGKALFEAIDAFKRSAQDMKVSLERGALNSVNPIHHEQLIPRVDEFAKRLRTSLEDSAVWGKAGEAQRAYNAVISDKLLPHMKVFEESVMKRTFQGYDGVWNLEGWESKVRELLRGTDPGNRRHVLATLDAMDELASVRRQFGDAGLASRIEKQTAKVRRTIGLADEVHDAAERMQALGDLVGGGGPVSGAIAGGLAGGIPGAAIGAALPGVVRKFVMGDLITAFQRLSGATDAAVSRGVDDWIRSSRVRGTGIMNKALPLPKLSGEARQLRDIALRRGISEGMALFQGDDKTPGAAFERWQNAIMDPEKFMEEIGKDFSTLQSESPETMMAIGARAEADRQYLIQRMPPNVAVSMARPNGYPPNRDAIEDWSYYVNAIRFPMRVVQNIGGARIQEIEALKLRRPRLFELAQLKTLEAMHRTTQAGEQLDDSFLARVQLFFPDLDGAGSPVFGRELGQYVRDWKLVDQAQRQQSRGGANPRQQQPGLLGSTLQRGATFGYMG